MYKLDENVPIHKALHSELLRRIGQMNPGNRIPTEEELVTEFGISRSTVNTVLSRLTEQGILYRVRSKGTFVSERKIKRREITMLLPGPGVLSGKSNSSFFMRNFLYGVLEEGLKRGFIVNTMMCTCDHRLESLNPAAFRSLPADANVIIPSEWWYPVFPDIVACGCRVACFNRQLISQEMKRSLSNWYLLTYDMEAAVADAVRRFAADGRRRILVLEERASWCKNAVGTMRGGYMKGLERAGLPFEKNLCPEIDYLTLIHNLRQNDDFAVCALYDELWRRERFDAVIIPSYFYASPLLKVLAAKGISVPNDVAVISVDDWVEHERLTPSVSYYARHPHDYGIEAVQGLDQDDFLGREKILQLDFIAHDSTRNFTKKANAASKLNRETRELDYSVF